MKSHLLVVSKKSKIWFLSHNFMTIVGSATDTKEAQLRNIIDFCTKYGFDRYLNYFW